MPNRQGRTKNEAFAGYLGCSLCAFSQNNGRVDELEFLT